MFCLSPVAGKRTYCEWKGWATYYSIDYSSTGREVAWTYEHPSSGYEEIREHIAFYPGRGGSCSLDGEEVVPQPGDFYGGWVTSNIDGPVKGGPGTRMW